MTSTPEDPFDRPPNESGEPRRPAPPSSGSGTDAGAEPTAPIQPGVYPGAYPGSTPGSTPGSAPGSTPPDPPPAAGPEGYWERQAREQAERTGPGQPGGAAPAYPPSAYGQPGYPQQGYPPVGYGQPPYAGGYGYAVAPAHPSATTALALGLVGLIGGFVSCGLLCLVSPFAIVVGRKTMREIDSANGQLGGRSNAKTGFVLGIVGTVLLALAVLVLVLVVVGLVAAGSSGGSGSAEF